MSEHSKISWTDHTWSPWEGCQKVGPGCDNCYAEARNQRFAAGSNWGPGAPRRKTAAASWRKPLQWAKQAKADGKRLRVFPSLCDPFDNAVNPAWRNEFFDLIVATPELTWLLLTKRIGNVGSMVPAWLHGALPDNVWLGATVVNQQEADRDIPKLLAMPARVRFLSIEPMLGPVDLTIDSLVCQPCPWCADQSGDPDTGAVEHCRRCEWSGKSDEWGIDWVIAGGESGRKARPTHPDWFRSLRDQCTEAGVPFHFKQWGEWASVSEVEGPAGLPSVRQQFANGATVRRVGKKAAGRLLNGVEHNGFPS